MFDTENATAGGGKRSKCSTVTDARTAKVVANNTREAHEEDWRVIYQARNYDACILFSSAARTPRMNHPFGRTVVSNREEPVGMAVAAAV
ncbi:hypothetical protein [Arthrobacter sp. P2b]|uniref:hypothetical protein n=1 Tax=Arthrobacter sp. P2b TaxID=1938741 RepID=UPI0011166CEE|nr:hypothetical protein [Arthrobacter sp. P2b]